MKNTNYKELTKDILVIALGLIVSGFGIGLIIIANLGGDPASVFHMGVSNTLNVSYGTAAALVNFAILAVVLAVDKSYVNIASFMAMFLIGYTADLTTFIYSQMFFTEPMLVIKFILLLLGIFFMAIGINIYILVGYGVAAIDIAAEIISDKANLPYDKVRIGSDVFYIVAGFIMGGSFGIGTIISAFLIGPSIQKTRKPIQGLIDSNNVGKRHEMV